MTSAGRFVPCGWPSAHAALMTLVAVSFYLASEWFAQRFAGDGQLEVAALAAVLIRIVAFGQLPQALLMVLTGRLRGAGETRGPLALSFLGFLAVRIPLAYWLAWDRISLDIGPLHRRSRVGNGRARGLVRDGRRSVCPRDADLRIVRARALAADSGLTTIDTEVGPQPTTMSIRSARSTFLETSLRIQCSAIVSVANFHNWGELH